jgi:hypothetical protein
MRERSTMTVLARRKLMAGLAALPALAACETAPRPQRSAAPAATGPSEPAPLPSDMTDDFLAARRAGRTAAPTGADAMPGFDPGQRVGADMTTAPIPSGGPRLLGPR